MTDRDPTYFFLHVMKTGGTTFIQHIRANFPIEAVYPAPAPRPERRRAYGQIEALLEIDPESRRSIRVFTGHFPFVASELVGADLTITILRDPIERTISLLRHCKRGQKRLANKSLEEIYDDGWMYQFLIHNYQSKLFSMTIDDRLVSHLDVIDVDDRRLEIAKANLQRVDVLGLHDHYLEFLDTLRNEHGWQIDDVPDQRVSTEDWEAPPHLPERIAADNAADIALYEHACRLHDSRRPSVTT